MLLTGRRIFTDFIIEGGNIDNIKGASYDLTVGEIFVDGESYKTSVSIEPQQTVFVMSKERIILDHQHTGYAHPKTKRTYDGLLALSTGLIDPSYDGYVASAVINFESEPKEIRIGDAFLRLTIHKLDVGVNVRQNLLDKDHYRERNRQLSKKFPNTFLDIDNHSSVFEDRIIKRVQKSFWNWTVGWIALIGIIISITALYVNNTSKTIPKDVYESYIQSEIDKRSSIQNNVDAERVDSLVRKAFKSLSLEEKN